MKKKERTIVIGLGRLGSSIATKLSLKGEDVVVIDKNADSFRKLADTFSGYQVVGDVIDIDVLENAGIAKAHTVVATTDDDNVNIMIAQICFYIYNIPTIFVRLTDNDKAVLIDSCNIHAIYPFLLSMEEFERVLHESEAGK